MLYIERAARKSATDIAGTKMDVFDLNLIVLFKILFMTW